MLKSAAAHTSRSSSLGSLKVGKRAVLCLVDGDTTRDITALRRGKLVMKGNAGRWPAAVREGHRQGSGRADRGPATGLLRARATAEVGG